MLCNDCKAICVEPAETAVVSGDTTYYLQDPFKPLFQLLKLSVQAGCTCCAFLQHCLESHTKFNDYQLRAIEAAPVMLKWFEMCEYEDGGAYLSL